MFTKFQLVRSEAIKTTNPVYVDLNPGVSWCYGFSTVSSCSCESANSCLYSGTENSISPLGDEGVAMAVTSLASNFTFSGNQGISSSSGTVTFSNSAGAISVVISRLGRIKMCSDTVAGYQGC
jgi:Tfp pilus assembly protein FimT